MCGVFGVRAPGRDVARLAYFGLFALQHRGQESAGIAVSEDGRLTALRDLGLVAAGVRRAEPLRRCTASSRSATRATRRPAATPGRTRSRSCTTAARAPSRSATTATSSTPEELRERAGKPLASTSDSEVIAALIADDPRPLEEAVAATMGRLEGAATVVGLADGKLFAFRDQHGFRPLVLGRLGDDPVVASETCALDLVGAKFEREVRPGELRGRRRARAAVDPGDRAGRARSALHLRVLLPRAPRHAPRGRRDPRRARADGRAAREGVAGRGRPRAADPRLGHAGRDRLRARDRDPVQRGADQEPLRRPHVHPARAGHARAGDPHEVQPARRGRRQAPRRRRRLDRARLDDAADRADAVRRGSRGGAHPDLLAADRVAVLLRHRPRVGGRADRRTLDASRRCARRSARRASPTSRSKGCRRRRAGPRTRSAAPA